MRTSRTPDTGDSPERTNAGAVCPGVPAGRRETRAARSPRPAVDHSAGRRSLKAGVVLRRGSVWGAGFRASGSAELQRAGSARGRPEHDQGFPANTGSPRLFNHAGERFRCSESRVEYQIFPPAPPRLALSRAGFGRIENFRPLPTSTGTVAFTADVARTARSRAGATVRLQRQSEPPRFHGGRLAGPLRTSTSLSDGPSPARSRMSPQQVKPDGRATIAGHPHTTPAGGARLSDSEPSRVEVQATPFVGEGSAADCSNGGSEVQPPTPGLPRPSAARSAEAARHSSSAGT